MPSASRSMACRAALVLGALIGFGLLMSQSAPAFIYWANTGNTIGRANLNGSSAKQDFITTTTNACGVAVTRTHIYWTTTGNAAAGTGTIGRAKRNGTAIKSNFITGLTNPCGIAVSRNHVYWANTNPAGGIGRAALSGKASTVKRTFIPTSGYACGVAVNGTHVFWGNRDDGTVGRAKLNGAVPNQAFVTAGSNICMGGVNKKHIFWTSFGSDSIGRASINGNPSSVRQSLFSGDGPCGLALTRTSIFWANSGTNSIGRAKLNGTAPNAAFIPGANVPCWVAVDPPAPKCRVPNLHGKTVDASRRILRRRNCRLGQVTRGPSGSVPAGRVASQSPAPGTKRPARTRVDVKVSTGPPARR